jgi:hypothetical protein
MAMNASDAAVTKQATALGENMENAVLRGTGRHPLLRGDRLLASRAVGPV